MQPSQNIWQHPLFRQNFRGAETQVDNRTFNYTSFLLSILEFPMDLRMRKDRIHYLQKVQYTVDAVTSSGILKAKQELGRTFNSDKLGRIDFTKISKLTMCSA